MVVSYLQGLQPLNERFCVKGEIIALLYFYFLMLLIALYQVVCFSIWWIYGNPAKNILKGDVDKQPAAGNHHPQSRTSPPLPPNRGIPAQAPPHQRFRSPSLRGH